MAQAVPSLNPSPEEILFSREKRRRIEFEVNVEGIDLVRRASEIAKLAKSIWFYATEILRSSMKYVGENDEDMLRIMLGDLKRIEEKIGELKNLIERCRKDIEKEMNFDNLFR